MESSLAGRLLVATPELTDDLFARSVILVLQHDEETAEGVVLNRPLDASIDDVLPGWQEGATEPARVFQGGPVQLDSAIGLVGVPGDSSPPPGVKRLFGAIALVDLDAPQEIVRPEVSALRIFGAVALFVLLIACVNFTNLATARSLDRAKEVGIEGRSEMTKDELIDALRNH